MTAAATAAEARAAHPSFGTNVAFGIGSTAESIALAAISGYAMFYYNQVLGLPAALAGLAITVSIIFDGVVDPFIGSISDRTRSRFGRRHPFMFLTPLPYALILFALFNPPGALPTPLLFAWFMVAVVSLRIVMSMFHVPHLALGGEMSNDYKGRTRVMAYANFMGAIGTTATGFVALTFFFNATPEYPRGLLNPAGYGPFSLAAATACFTALSICAWTTSRQIPFLQKAPADLPRFRPLDFFRDMQSAFSNRNYLFLLIAVFFLAPMVGLRAAMNLYVNTFFWELTSEQIRWFSFANLAAFFVSFLLIARLHGWFDKRRAMVTTAALLAIVPAIPIVMRALGAFPEAGSSLFLPLLMFFGALQAGIGSMLTISVLSAIADIADQNELKHGIRQEGVLYSTRSVFAKVEHALGAFCAGLALQLAGLPAKAVPGNVAPEVIWRIAMIDGPVAIVPGLIAAFFYAKYRIDRASYDATRVQLVAYREQQARERTPLGAAGTAAFMEGPRELDANPPTP